MALIADDDAACRKFCAQALAPLNYSLIQVQDAADAIRQALRGRPRLLLMDLHLPDMDACEAARQLVRAWPGVRVECRLVGMTADDSQAALLNLYAAGFYRVLVKPFPVASLLAATRLPGLVPSRSLREQSPPAGHLVQFAFLTELPGLLAALDFALAGTDWTVCESILHRICGAAAMADLAEFDGLGRKLTLRFQQPQEHSLLVQTYLDFLAAAKELLEGDARSYPSAIRHRE